MAFLLELVVKFAVVTGLFGLLIAVMPGIKARSIKAAAIAAPTVGLANITLGWALTFVAKALLFLPNLLTLGLLGLVIPVIVNAILIKGIDLKFGDALTVKGLEPLMVASALITVAAFVVGRVM